MNTKINSQKHFDVLSIVNQGISQLQPLADTMSSALKAYGVDPAKDLTALTSQFHQYIAAPNSGITDTANMINNVVGYFQTQLGSYKNGTPQSKVEKIVGSGANNELLKINAQKTVVDFVTKNPLIVLGFVILLGFGVMWYLDRK